MTGTSIVENELGNTEKVDSLVGVITIIFFFLMGGLFYLRSKLVYFSSYWRYTSDNILVGYVILGLFMIRMEREDYQSQLKFLKLTLNKRFKNEHLDDIAKDYWKVNSDVSQVLNWFARYGNNIEAIEVFDFLVDLAYYNDNLNRRELSFLMKSGEYLGIDQNTIKSIVGIREQQRRRREEEKRENVRQKIRKGKNYYRNKNLNVLGLNGNANFDDVKKTYRSLARTLHPDRFMRKSEGEQQAAHERFTEINLAYEKLKEMIG